MEGWSLGLQMEPLSSLQNCLAALAWTARIQRSGLASDLPAIQSGDAKQLERLDTEVTQQEAEGQIVSSSGTELHNGTGGLHVHGKDPADVRENGYLSAGPANGLADDKLHNAGESSLTSDSVS